MKYTMSRDGVERCNVNLTMRFSRETFKEYTAKAKKHGYTSVKDMLESLLLDEEVLYTKIKDMEEMEEEL